MAPQGVKRPPAWPSADETKSDAKRAHASAQAIRCYRARQTTEPPQINTWVHILPETRIHGYIRTSDRLAAEAPALVAALTIEDGVGSAVVIYPNPLVLCHSFGGAELVRVLVPFERLRPYKGDVTDVKQLEAKLFQSVFSATRKKAAQKGVTILEGPETHTSCAIASCSGQAPPVEATSLSDAKPTPEKTASLSNLSMRDFTASVSRVLHKRGMKVTRTDLTTSLRDVYDEPAITAGLQKLSEQNKVFLCEDLVFGLD